VWVQLCLGSMGWHQVLLRSLAGPCSREFVYDQLPVSTKKTEKSAIIHVIQSDPIVDLNCGPAAASTPCATAIRQ
jgi:hypothetical protein